ncbi:MAG TPA: hypothetical protein PK771_00960 [Spirochaetota bacterium]|nr:hypothetical protein [Spirochaetota bacterium]
MNSEQNRSFGTSFERCLISFLSIISGLTILYLSIKGPLVLNHIHYKTSISAIYQIQGQDLVNIFLITPILLIGGISLFLKKDFSRYLIIFTPLYLIYYVLSYTIGLEWSSSIYIGNSENYSFHFLLILVSAVITLLYSLSIFPKSFQNSFKKKWLIVYSVLFVFFILIFTSMWFKDIINVIKTGTTLGYKEAPTGFWTIRFFDIGFTIPLGLISVYLLWTKPNETYSVQFLFYGFFITMLTAVNSMGIIMYLNNDPSFSIGSMAIFIILALIVFTGFIFVIKNFKKINR